MDTQKFFETNNFNLLYNILNNDLQQKFNHTIDENGKIKLFQIMNTISTNNASDNLKNLNLKTLKISAPILKGLCDKQPNIIKTQENIKISRDMEFKQNIPDFQDMRPKYLNSKNEDIDTAFNNVNNRYIEKKPNPINFRLNNDNNMNDVGVKAQFNIINTNRNDNKITNIQELNGHEIKNNQNQETNIQEINNNQNQELNSHETNNNHNQETNIHEINNNMIQFNNEQNKLNENIQIEIKKKQEQNIELENKFQNNLNFPGGKSNSEINNNYEDEQLSQIDIRNKGNLEIINQNKNNDSINFYKENQTISENIKSDFLEIQTKEVNNKDFIIDTEFKKKLKTNYLEINSYSRNWLNLPDITKINRDSNRYYFVVDFSPSTNEWVNIPIYENNPFTFINIYPGGNIVNYDEINFKHYSEVLNQISRDNYLKDNSEDKNVRDPLLVYQNEIYNKVFKNKEIIKNPFYDKSKGNGDISYYVKKLISGTSNASVMNIYKNVHKIELVSVIVPYDYFLSFSIDREINNNDIQNSSLINLSESDITSFFTDIFQNSIVSYPYLLVHIEELNGVYDSTIDIVSKCFCKIVVGGDWTTNVFESYKKKNINGLPGFVMMVPSNGGERTYDQSALANINKMTIRLLNPSGQIININNDNAVIDQICYLPLTESKYNKRFIIIKTKNWLTSNMFLINNIIKISNYENIYKDEDYQLNINYFEKFINRDEGHTILNVGYIPNGSVLGEDKIFFDKNKDGYINLIFIQSEGYFDDIEGEWVTKLGDNTNECKELVSYGFMEYLTRPELKDYTYGKLINLNMQINVSFNITTIENDSTQIKSNII
jgi:hypothetical protein